MSSVLVWVVFILVIVVGIVKGLDDARLQSFEGQQRSYDGFGFTPETDAPTSTSTSTACARTMACAHGRRGGGGERIRVVFERITKTPLHGYRLGRHRRGYRVLPFARGALVGDVLGHLKTGFRQMEYFG